MVVLRAINKAIGAVLALIEWVAEPFMRWPGVTTSIFVTMCLLWALFERAP